MDIKTAELIASPKTRAVVSRSAFPRVHLAIACIVILHTALLGLYWRPVVAAVQVWYDS